MYPFDDDDRNRHSHSLVDLLIELWILKRIRDSWWGSSDDKRLGPPKDPKSNLYLAYGCMTTLVIAIVIIAVVLLIHYL